MNDFISLQEYADDMRRLIREAEEAAAKDPNVIKHRLSAGRHLFEASTQMTYEEFGAWVRRHFDISEKAARKLIHEAQVADRSAAKN
jgi:hypothetical protein